jgi:hypothetical protein
LHVGAFDVRQLKIRGKVGVKTTMNWTVHLRAPAVHVVKAEEHFPEIVRLLGMRVERFTIGQALENAEAKVQRAEKRYRIHGVTALSELLQEHPLFIHHPRVARLCQEAITRGGINLARPPGRPKGAAFLDERIIYSVVERLQSKPFELSLRKSCRKVGETWQSSYSSVRDAYKRAGKTLIPLAVVVPAESHQPDSGGFKLSATQVRGQFKVASGEFVYRKPLTEKVQIIYKLQCADPGSIEVQGWFETSGKRCHVLVKVIDKKLMMGTEEIE